jgi:hypothetical protein
VVRLKKTAGMKTFLLQMASEIFASRGSTHGEYIIGERAAERFLNI